MTTTEFESESESESVQGWAQDRLEGSDGVNARLVRDQGVTQTNRPLARVRIRVRRSEPSQTTAGDKPPPYDASWATGMDTANHSDAVTSHGVGPRGRATGSDSVVVTFKGLGLQTDL